MAGIFKAYDIRGLYGETLTESIAYKIGRAFVTWLRCKTVVVGRDMRTHSPPLFDALTRGLREQGADVLDLGLCSTPMSNFANGLLKADGSIMITASHNPGSWNGFKLSRADAIPIGEATGLRDIERIVHEGAFAPPAPVPGKRIPTDIFPEYARNVRRLADVKRPIHIAADVANAMGIYELRVLEGLLEVEALFNTLDGTFPHHEANPMHAETLVSLQKMLRTGRYAFGVAFDGDADRVGFLDEKGDVIPMDLIATLIAQDILRREKGVILHDLRSSRVFPEVVAENGGEPRMCRVGHAFIKQQMREAGALFAGELSGHYYFRENYFTESSSMATLCIANIVSRSQRPLSELIAPLRRYFASGEINLHVKDPQRVLETIRTRYADGRVFTLDGISVEYPDWWFNLRASNTEPLLRLNLESRTRALMETKRDEILSLLRNS